MDSKIYQNLISDSRLEGLPKDYPVPEYHPDLLFYIQRNQNKNTVVYKLNRNLDGFINRSNPIVANWINYSDGGEVKKLNFIQNKFAYGYQSKEINADTFEFYFPSYKELRFFLAKNQHGEHQVILNIGGLKSILNNVYVFAEEFGVFPQVKFIELFGHNLENMQSTYQKILL